MLDFGAVFVNANSKVKSSGFMLSLLLALCSSNRWSPESLAVLLRRKADVMDRDDLGRTCLHLCLSKEWDLPYHGFPLNPSYPHPIHIFSAGIILLIEHGADVHAKDGDGHSVSAYAYAKRTGLKILEELGCVWGDVWDFALAICGYDISEFRRQHGVARRARYNARYTRQVFEGLWAGYEHLCPYYTDEDNHALPAKARVLRFRVHRERVEGVFFMEEVTMDIATDSENEGSGVVDSGDEDSDVGEAENEDYLT